MVAIAFFFVGVVVAAISKNFTYMLVGRSVQGIGGGGVIAMTDIIVTDLVPLRFRGKWNGIIAGTWSIGSVSGPIIGMWDSINPEGCCFKGCSWLMISFSGGAFAGSATWVSATSLPIFNIDSNS